MGMTESKRSVQIPEVAAAPTETTFYAPELSDSRYGPVGEALLAVSHTGRVLFSALAVDSMRVVCDSRRWSTKTPAQAQVAPPGPEGLLAIIPCKKDAENQFKIAWSPDRSRASMRLKTVLQKAEVMLPGRGFVLELKVRPFKHPTQDWALGVETTGTIRAKETRRKVTPPAPTEPPQG